MRGAANSIVYILSTTGLSTPALKGGSRSLSVVTQFKFDPHDFGVDCFGGSDSIAINVAFVLEPR